MEQYPRRDMLGSKEKHKEQAYRELYEWMEVAVVSILCMVVLFTFAFRFASVDGNSMKPTLHNRDWLLVSGLFYQPQPGDVVVVTQQGDPEHPLIKRIIATEFQEVDIDFEAGVVYVDGKALEEPYVNAPTTSQWNSPRQCRRAVFSFWGTTATNRWTAVPAPWAWWIHDTLWAGRCSVCCRSIR